MSSDAETVLALMRAMAGHAFFATCDGDLPAVRWVSPIVEAISSIWIATFADASKVRQVRANPHVVLLFTSLPNGDQSVRVRGTAEVVEDSGEKTRIWGLAPYDLTTYFPDGRSSPAYGLLRVRSEKITWRETWDGETRTLAVS